MDGHWLHKLSVGRTVVLELGFGRTVVSERVSDGRATDMAAFMSA